MTRSEKLYEGNFSMALQDEVNRFDAAHSSLKVENRKFGWNAV
jgi:hypothetical protein